jgi:hypothetical protein
MRGRERILQNLEDLYRGEFSKADDANDDARMAALNFDFQRDQLYLEVMLDLRDLFAAPEAEEEDKTSLLEKAQAIRRLTKLRGP